MRSSTSASGGSVVVIVRVQRGSFPACRIDANTVSLNGCQGHWLDGGCGPSPLLPGKLSRRKEELLRRRQWPNPHPALRSPGNPPSACRIGRSRRRDCHWQLESADSHPRTCKSSWTPAVAGMTTEVAQVLRLPSDHAADLQSPEFALQRFRLSHEVAVNACRKHSEAVPFDQ